MLTIKTNDGTLHKFTAEQYTDYDIVNDYVVVKRKEQWIAVFAKEHFMWLVVD